MVSNYKAKEVSVKRILVALVMLASLSAYSQTAASIALTVGQWVFKSSEKLFYVQVEATADNAEQARREAFRKAVEEHSTLVLSERELVGDKLTRNEIITYSSGYVKDHKVLNETRVGNKTRMTIDVWVSNSKIADRLTTIGANSGAEINGSEIEREWRIDRGRELSDSDRQRNGMKVMSALLRDYPRFAIQPTVQKTWVGKSGGVTALFVKVDIKFSDKWIAAADEVISLTRNSKMPGNDKTGVALWYGFMNMSGPNGYYTNPSVQTMWVEAFQKDVNMKLTFLGAGKPYSNCWTKTKEALDGKLFGWQNGRNGSTDYGTYVIENKTVTNTYVFENSPKWGWSDEKFVNWVSKFDKVEAQLVDSASCP
jgi:hypothetical protein